jgi:general secretion pathway protein I
MRRRPFGSVFGESTELGPTHCDQILGGVPARCRRRAAARPRAGEPGFTLFEVMVALAIVAIAGVAAVQSFAVAARLADRSRVELALSLAAQEILAEARLQPISSGTSRGELREGPYLVRWSRGVARTDAPPLQQVRVTVEVADQSAPPLELETYVSGL